MSSTQYPGPESRPDPLAALIIETLPILFGRARTAASVAKSVVEQKEQHPDRFCPEQRCLWKTGDGSHCPRHRGERR